MNLYKPKYMTKFTKFVRRRTPSLMSTALSP